MAGSKNWYPLQQAEFLTFAQNYCGLIAGSPTTYGCVAGDGTSLSAKLSDFETKFGIAEAPETRTPVTIAQKDLAMAALRAEMKRTYKKVRAANLSADLLIELGVPVPDVEPSSVPVPGTSPILVIRKVDGRMVEMSISDELTPGKKAKPEGVAQYQIFSHVGETAPAELSEWTLEGQGTRFILAATLPASVEPGTKVWFAARWLNGKGEAGPVATPVATFLGGGTVSEAA
jgi:hypothetical protein